MDNYIVRGTTPVIEFVYDDITVSDIAIAYLTLKQNNKIIVERTLDTATVSDNKLYWQLSQEETLLLSAGKQVHVLCDWKLNNGIRGISEPADYDVYNPGKNEVI